MKSTCTKGMLFLGLALLLLGAAACTQQKPAVPTPTLVVLNQTPVLPASGTEAPTEAGTPASITPQVPSAAETTGPAQPTLLPTPTIGIASAPPPASATEVPSSGGTSSGGGCPSRYTVQRGDWFYQIARKCGVSPQALMAANPGVNANFVYPGQGLNIPGGGAAPSGGGPSGRTYVVQPGDNMFRIGLRFGVSYVAIASANGIPYPYNVYVGQSLQIP
jgi:peptidoglycan endopeptidase LytF